MKTISYGPLTLAPSEDGSYSVIACDKTATCVSIPQEVSGHPVTAIAADAFSDCTALASVIFPEPCEEALFEGHLLTDIGDHAFSGCTSLTAVSLPAGLRFVGWGCFRGCTALVSLASSPDVYFCPYAFSGCTALSEVPPLRYLSEGIFEGCTSLSRICLAADLDEIPESAFEHCEALSGIDIHASVRVIGALAFRSCRALCSVSFAVCDGWYVEDSYREGARPIDVGDPLKNAEILRGMDFDDGILRWFRK